MQRTEDRGFLCIDAFALPSAEPQAAIDATRQARDRLHERAWKATSREAAAEPESLELLTLGATDLLVVHRVPDLAFVAVGSVAAPSLHQRSTGALLGAGGTIGWADLREHRAGHLFHAVLHLKLEPGLALSLGGTLPGRVASGLSTALRARMRTDRCERGAALDRLELLVATGLDEAELVAILRAPDLVLLVRAVDALGRMKAHEIDVGDADERLEALAFSELSGADALATTPLFAYVASTMGLPLPAAMRPGPKGMREACSEGAVLRLPRSASGPRGLVLASRAGGDLRFRPWTLAEVAELLRSGTPQESHLVVRAWAKGARTPDTISGGLDEALSLGLRKARSLWLPGGGVPDEVTAWGALRSAAARGHWSYGRTNAALAMMSSLVAGLSSRADVENHLELAGPLAAWLRQVIAAPHDRDVVARAYRHLDRLMRTRADSPARPPGTHLAYSARAGTRLLRDGFRAYLSEILALRGLSQITPVLVDSAETSLRVKFGGPLAYFEVSVQRLLTPVLWPAIVHEVEHLRLSRMVGGLATPAVAAYLRRQPPGVWGLSPEEDDRVGVGLIDRLDQVHAVLRDDPDPRLQRWGELAPGLVEVAADLAILDAGVLPGADLDARVNALLGALWPNLAMDLRERHGGRPWTPERCNELASQLLFRFVNLWVLAYFKVGTPFYWELLDSRPPEDDWPTTRHDVLALIRNGCIAGARSKALQALMVEIMRPAGELPEHLLPRLQSALELARDQLVELASYGAPVRASDNQTAAIESGALGEFVCRMSNGVAAQGWPEGLALVHALRRRGRVRGQAVAAVRSLLGEVAKAAAAEAPFVRGAPHLRIAPRGGLEPHSVAARAQAEALPGLVQALREPIRLQAAASLETFLLCPLQGRVLLLVLHEEPHRHQRELESAFREGALKQGVAFGEVVRSQPRVTAAVQGLLGAGRMGPMALLVDLHRRAVAHTVVHPGLGDPEVTGRADRVVSYLRLLLSDGRAGAPPGSWCHRGGTGGTELFQGLEALGLLGGGVSPDRPTRPGGPVLEVR